MIKLEFTLKDKDEFITFVFPEISKKDDKFSVIYTNYDTNDYKFAKFNIGDVKSYLYELFTNINKELKEDKINLNNVTIDNFIVFPENGYSISLSLDKVLRIALSIDPMYFTNMIIVHYDWIYDDDINNDIVLSFDSAKYTEDIEVEEE